MKKHDNWLCRLRLRSGLLLGLGTVSSIGCGSNSNKLDGGSEAGLPAGSGCGHYIDGGATIKSAEVLRCQPNPSLPNCHACNFLSDRGDGAAPGICVFGCRVGMSGDCPSGQTCIANPPSSANGCISYNAEGFCQ